MRKYKFRIILLFISNCISITCIIILGGTSSISVRNFLHQKVDEIHKSRFEQIVADVDNTFSRAFTITESLKKNQRIKNNISKIEQGKSSVFIKNKLVEEIDSLLDYIQDASRRINTINIVTPQIQYGSQKYYFSVNLHNELINRKYEGIEIMYPRGSHTVKTSSDTRGNFIGNIENMYYFACSSEGEGNKYNVYVIMEKDVMESLNNSMKHVVITDDEGNKVYVGDEIKESKKTLNQSAMYETKLSFANWKLKYIPDDSYFQEHFKNIVLLLIAIVFSSILLSFVFSFFLSRIVMSPVTSITQKMETYRVGKGLKEDFPLKKRHTLNLKKRLFIYFTATALIPVLIFSIMYYLKTSNNIINNIMSQVLSQSFGKVSMVMSEYIDNKMQILKRIVFDNPTQKYMIEKDEQSYEQLVELVENNIYLGLDDLQIDIYDMENRLVFSNYLNAEKKLDSEYYEILKHSGRGAVFTVARDQINTDVVFVGQKFNLLYDYNINSTIGFARVRITHNNLLKQYMSIYNNSTRVHIIDGEGKDIFSNDRYFTHELEQAGEITDGRKKGVYCYPILKTPWRLLVVYDYKVIYNETNRIYISSIYILCAALVLTVLITIFISKKIMQQVNKVNRAFDQFELGEYDNPMIDGLSISEIDEIAVTFYSMVDKIEQLFDDVLIANKMRKNMEEKKDKAEMFALQAQISPHFIFNTMENIVYMIRNNHKKESIKMLNDLGELLRCGMGRKSALISLEDELNYVRSYINIVKIRYGSNIDFKFDIPQNLLKSSIMQMLVQPIVENAVYHGLDNGSIKGKVIIKCYSDNNKLIIKVMDNGKGIKDSHIGKMRENLNKSSLCEKIGILNVQSRIKLFYGNEFKVSIESELGKGTSVTIRIPLIFQTMESNDKSPFF